MALIENCMPNIFYSHGYNINVHDLVSSPGSRKYMLGCGLAMVYHPLRKREDGSGNIDIHAVLPGLRIYPESTDFWSTDEV